MCQENSFFARLNLRRVFFSVLVDNVLQMMYNQIAAYARARR